MAGIERSVASFSAGMILNQNKLLQKKESYSYALNAIKSSPMVNSSQLENERGFVDCINMGSPFLLLGQIWLGEKKYVLFTKSLDGVSPVTNAITLVDLDTAIQSPLCNLYLNFLSTNEIQGTYKVNYLNQRIIYWVDGANDDRSLNIDNSPLTVPIGQLSMNPSYSAAVIGSTTIKDSGGKLQAGTYEFALRYRFQNYNISTIFGLCLASYVTIQSASSQPTDYGRFNGVKSGTLTSKAISLSIKDLDTTYQAVDVIVIQTLNGTSVVTSVDNLAIHGSTMTYIYTGFENATPIHQGLTAVTVDPASYHGSEIISQKENRLLIANLKQNIDILRYQQYANNIIAGYVVVPKLAQLNTPSQNSQSIYTQDTLYQSCSLDPTVTQTNMTLLRGEVYSFGLSFVLNSGLETQVFHIPGRPGVVAPPYGAPGELSLTTDHIRGGQSPVWMTQDTNYIDSSGNNLFSYWQSLTEVYPTGFDFPTGAVRHHKVPHADVLPITTVTTDSSNNNNLFINYLQLQFTNIVLPPAIQAEVKQIKFYMTPRDLDSNKSIVAKGAFIRTAISGADNTYTGNPAIASSKVSPRYVVPASPFSGIPADYDYTTDPANSKTAQREATFANVKLNMSRYGLGVGNGYDQGQAITDVSDLSFPSPNSNYPNAAAPLEKSKIFLFFHSPDTDAKADNNDIPALDASSVYLETKLSGTVNWYTNTAQNQTNPPRGTNAFGVNSIPSQIDFKGQCIFNNPTSRVSKVNNYKVHQAVYVPYNAKLSEATTGNLSLPYYGQQRESGTMVEIDTLTYPTGNTPVIDFTDYTNESSMKFNNTITNSYHPVYANSYNALPNGDGGQGSYNGPIGTRDYRGRFLGFPTAGATGGSAAGSTAPNIAIYYYGSLGNNNDSQYGKILGATYRFLGMTIDVLTTDSNGVLLAPASAVVGDTFIDMYTVKRTAYTNYTSDAGTTSGVLFQINMAGVSSFPVESSLNYRMNLTPGLDGSSSFPKDLYGAPTDLWFDKNFYYDNYLKLDDDYNKKYSKLNFGPTQINQIPTGTSLVSTNKLIYQTRIAYSQQSLTEDTIDYWRTSLANDYRDLPKNRGPVTGLFSKQDQLHALTRDSVFDVYGSNQNLTTTSAQNIAIGTGSFFGTEPKEVMAIDGGFAGTSSKNSLVETPFGYLYIDKNKKKIILYNQSMEDITLRGLNDTWKMNGGLFLYDQLPDLKKLSGFDNPVNGVGFTAIYDSQNYRILITKLDYQLIDITRYKGIFSTTTSYATTDFFILNGVLSNLAGPANFSDVQSFINKSLTFSYLPQLEQWVSEHSYLPTNYLPHPTGFLAKTKNSNIKLSNSGPMGKFFNSTPDPFIIELVTNQNPLETKVLDSLKINVQTFLNNDSDQVTTNTFFDSFYVYTEMQASGSITLSPTINLTKKEKDWSINKFFDQVNRNSNTQLFSSSWTDVNSTYPIDKVINQSTLSYTKPWYQLGRFRDKYFVIRFTKNNLDNGKIIINFVSSIYRRSVR